MSAAATAAGYLYASGRLSKDNRRAERHEEEWNMDDYARAEAQRQAQERAQEVMVTYKRRRA